jgi:hypothetical protein
MINSQKNFMSKLHNLKKMRDNVSKWKYLRIVKRFKRAFPPRFWGNQVDVGVGSRPVMQELKMLFEKRSNYNVERVGGVNIHQDEDEEEEEKEEEEGTVGLAVRGGEEGGKGGLGVLGREEVKEEVRG